MFAYKLPSKTNHKTKMTLNACTFRVILSLSGDYGRIGDIL